jgi:TRAP-type C4-dicarboxylate transport system substrate-binding protein
MTKLSLLGRRCMPSNTPIRRLAPKALVPLAALLALSSDGLFAQEFDFTMGVIVSPGDLYSELTASVPARIREATGGRVAITVSDSLIAPNQIGSAVRDGRLPMSAALHTYLAADEPRMGIANLPGLIVDIHDYQRVRAAFWAADIEQIWLDRWNAVVLAEGAWCYQRLFSKEPIRRLEDFRGKRLRVHNPQTAAMMNALGARPTALSMLEVVPALERGVIDGLFTSVCVGNAMELWRDAPHVQDWPIGPVTGWAILVNRDEWAALPDDLRESIRAAMRTLEQEAFSGYESFVEAALDNMRERGALVWSAPAAELERVMAPRYADAAYEAWYARARQLGFDGPAYIDRIRTALGRGQP